MNRRDLVRIIGLSIVWTSLRAAGRSAAGAGLGVASGAKDEDSRPWVYAFWLDGNVTKEGITADLEAMKNAGIGGLLFMDGSLGMPSGACRFMSGPWQEAFRHMVAEACRLGLSINLNNGAGWSGSGGPWISPEDASQRVIHSQLVLNEPSRFRAAVPIPAGIRHGHYRDIALLAYRLPGDVPHARIENFNSTKSFAGETDFEDVVPWPRVIPTNPQWPAVSAEQCLDASNFLDLTSRLQADTLQWRAPAGKWLLLRFGHTVSNGSTRMTQPEASGLETDKLSRAATQRHFAAYVAKLSQLGGTAGNRAIVATHIDSWEAGSGNWTPGLREEFQRRRGYDLLPYLATLAGFVVSSIERSERFLWDFRETVAELLLQNYAEAMRDSARAQGMRLSIEGYDAPCDDLRYSGRADEPMGEFWRSCYSGLPLADICETAASAGHVYGKRIVGAESFTALSGDYLDHPATLKPLADWALCVGINRFNLSEWIFQPWPGVAPGLSFGEFGTPFGRTVTWWRQSRPWHEYLERCQERLREGQFVADICFVTPEGAPYRFTPPIPATRRGVVPCRTGYNFDGCPAELVSRMRVENGDVVLPSGMRYKLLALPTYDVAGELVIRLAGGADYAYKPGPMPKVRTITPALLRAVKELVEHGATVLGWRPMTSPSLVGFPDCDMEISRLADELWGVGAGSEGIGQKRVGKGWVYWGRAPEEIFGERGVPPDFACSPNLTGILNYIHRRRDDGTDVYFIVNKSNTSVEGTLALRVPARQPRVSWPQSAEDAPLPYFSQIGDVTCVPVSLRGNESVFISFGGTDAADPIVEVSRDGAMLWPGQNNSVAPVDPMDDSFTMAAWVRWLPPTIPLPIEKNGQLRYERPLELPGPSIGTFTSPGQGRAGFAVGENGIVVFRYSRQGWVEPLLCHEAPVSAPIHVGVVYEERIPRLFLNGRLVKAGARAAEPLYGSSGWEDRRSFGVELASLQQFDDMLVAAGVRPVNAAEVLPAMDFSHGLIWESGRYRLKSHSGRLRELTVTLPSRSHITGFWSVSFDRDWGGPGEVLFARLEDWSRREEPGIRYYSGVARYRKQFPFKQTLAPGVRVYLDLGRVADVAEIVLNDVEVGVLWNPPYRLDVTQYLSADNNLEVRVTNRWVNRLIGDAQRPDDARIDTKGKVEAWPDWLLAGKRSPTGRYTFTSQRLWRAGDPLVTSGLLGPVSLRFARTLLRS
ncbi:MAG: hypothetical protein JSR66_08795 [Proteobacteria bacterium]|nr:hypothetical protein [Pseudomonadota bacterium]